MKPCECGCGQLTAYRFKRGHVAKLRRIEPMTSYVVDPQTGCWVWTKSLTNGYGRIGSRLAYRLIYERLRGPVPKGRELDHVCRNRACVNPDHLEPVTRTVNVRRGSVARLDECAVYEIRDLLAQGWAKVRIAKVFGVTPGTISHIATGRSWADVGKL